MNTENITVNTQSSIRIAGSRILYFDPFQIANALHDADTDAVNDLMSISCDVALVPIGGTYTMTAKEAAKLINVISPEVAVPTHYGSIVGKKQDADVFRENVKSGIQVAIKL